jgi:hypothetical protein
MIPPFATARTTAREVQLRGVPLPTQRSGREVSTARACEGTRTAAAAGGMPAARASAAQALTATGASRTGDAFTRSP